MRGLYDRCRQLTTLSTIFAACGAAAAGQGEVYSVLARTGLPSPYGTNASYNRFISNGYELTRPLIGQSGDVCFLSTLAGSDVPAGTSLAVIRGGPQPLNAVWRQGMQATGLPPGVSFAGLYDLQMNSQGEVGYVASLFGPGVQPGVNDRGVWVGNASGTTCLARDGTPMTVADFPNASMDWLTSAKVTAPESFGPMVVSGNIAGTGLGTTVRGVLQQSSDGFVVAMLANTQLPGAAPGTSIFNTTPIVGPSGIGAYQTTLSGSGVGTVTVNGIPIATDKAITTGMGSQLRTVARSGFQAPTEPVGVVFWQVWGGSARLAVNSRQSIAFSASMAGPGIYTSNNWAIWLDQAGQLTRVARLLDSAPLTGATIGSFAIPGGSFMSLTDDDAVIFTAMIMGSGINSSNNGTIIYSRNGARSLIARGGVDAPGLPAGVRIQNSTFGIGARIGSSGHVALAAKLEGSGVTSANDAAIFSWSPTTTQGLRLVCREGDVLGNYRITTLSQTGADLQVNGSGQMVFTATVVHVNDSSQTSRTAIIAASPDQSPWVLAVEGGALNLPSGPATARVVRMGASNALNDSGNAVFVADLGNGVSPDEAVIIATLTGGSTITPCRADYDNSGVLTVHDIYIFLTNWFRGDADYDNSGATEVLDIFAFLSDWYAGCP